MSATEPDAARVPPSALVVQLLGRPRIDVDGAPGYRYRSRKSWALLAFLLLGERPPTRSQLSALLFSEADDPLGALRWCLAEIRRALGPAAVLDGDPVRISLPAGATVDVDVLVRGHWIVAIQLPGLGDDLLDGLAIQQRGGSHVFDTVASSADEVLLGVDQAHLGFRASVLVEPGRVVLSTVVEVRNRRGRGYSALIRRIHPVVVRTMLAQAARKMADR